MAKAILAFPGTLFYIAPNFPFLPLTRAPLRVRSGSLVRFFPIRSLGDRLLLLCFACVCAFFALNFLFPLPDPKPYSLVVEDRHGRFMHAFLASDGMWRIRTATDDIPPKLRAMLIAREDRWFYYHPGVNPLAILRAVGQNVKAGRRVSGASTITMQVARLLEPKSRTYSNKFVEIFRAFQLEWKYSKDQILEMYLSMVPLGGNIEGLQTASLMYYEVPLRRLSTAQLIDLILIPRDPNDLRPSTNGAALLRERVRVAHAMGRAGILNEEEVAGALTLPATAPRIALPRRAPHFSLRVKELHPGSAEFRSSLDLDIQKTVELLLSQRMKSWRPKGIPNAAVIVAENATHSILAYLGSPDYDDAGASGQVDAARALRSPGSTLKPLLYALNMDRGVLTPRTRLLDTPYDAEGFLAENYDGSYSGLVYADEALRRSLNVPMVRLLKQTGVSSFVDLLGKVGFASLQNQRRNLGLSMILGGCGVSLEELVGAYATFPSAGAYTPLHFSSGSDKQEKGAPVFSPSSAFMVTEILEGLDRPDLPNNIESAINLPVVAFKTGTSYGRRDAWSIGYSSEFTIGVWVGDVRGGGNPGLVGSKFPAPLLIDLFNALSRSRSKSILPVPADIRARQVCTKSGMAAGPRCTETITDDYSFERTLQTPCTVCREELVSPDRTMSYCLSCLGTHPYKTMTVCEYPQELLHFWREQHEPFAAPPPHNPLCRQVLHEGGPAIVSPSDGMTYYLVSRAQQLCLQATSNAEAGDQYWYIDQKFIARGEPGRKLFVRLGGGEHTITCVDDRGRTTSIQITIVNV